MYFSPGGSIDGGKGIGDSAPVVGGSMTRERLFPYSHQGAKIRRMSSNLRPQIREK
jgi:hypothetical protein